MTITICDVAPRDGLQNEDTLLAPETRGELVNRLARAGVPRIEAVSFVNPARVPQMAGAEEVVQAIERREGVVYAGLVLNERGYERLAATDLDEVHVAFASTETLQPPQPERLARGVARGGGRDRRSAHMRTACAPR